MAKVEMSLQEYDQMKEKLSFYEEIINSITTPRTDKWNIDYFTEHENYSLPVESTYIDSMPIKVQVFLNHVIEENVKKWMNDNSIEGRYELSDYFHVNLGNIIHTNTETEKES